jgi:penicillin G amidase
MQALRYRFGRLALVLALAVVLAGCGGDDDSGFAANPIDQVPVSANVQVPGLGATTDVVFDELGIPHVYAPDMESALFVQGYLEASERFWEMDIFRRLAEGRLSEIFGKLTLSTDVGMRTIFMTRDGRHLEDALWEHTQAVDPEVARLLQAFSAGVNAWLADLQAGRNGATLPPEYTLGVLIDLKASDLAPWRPQDTLAIGRLEAWTLSETLEDEVGRAQMLAALPDAVARDVFRAAPASPTTVLPPQDNGVPGVRPAAAPAAPHLPRLPANLAEISAALRRLEQSNPLGTRAQGVGSNNWVVAPALSANGHAMLANDPHLPLFNPPIWYMLQLDTRAPDGSPVQDTGVIFPGLPGIILGNNQFGAWGATVAGFDVTDVYVEQVTTPPDYPTSPRTVLFQGRQVPVLRVEETFNVRHTQPVTEVIEIVPHHGPMVPDPNLNDNVVGLAATNMSFRWTGHELTDDPRFLVDIDQARDVNSFRAALQSFAVGAQNWVWADVQGNIAYLAHALVPQRPPGTVPYLPMDGTGGAEWLTDAQGNTVWLPDSALPQATNPSEGFLNTSNNDQFGYTLDNDPLNDPVYLAYSYDLGFRAERVRELLSNGSGARRRGAKITLADMSAYQYDHSSKEAARLLPFLFQAAANEPGLVTPAMADALARLRAWGSTTPPYAADSGIDPHDLRSDVTPRPTPVSEQERANAVATSIFAAWETRLGPDVFADDFAGTGIGAPGGQDATKALLHLLGDTGCTVAACRIYTAGPDGQSTLWDDQSTPQVESRDDILLRALGEGLDLLGQKFPGAPPENWLWGIIHQVRFEHFLGQAGLHIFDLGPFAAPGARFTVNPADYDLGSTDFTFSDGPSERYVAVLDPAGVCAVNALPGGNNGDPGGMAAANYGTINPDVHYGDLVPGWLDGETFTYHISRADVAAHAVRKVRYSP